MTFKTIFGRTAFLAAALALFLTATSEARAACEDPPTPGVDWSGCNFSGADLYSVDLQGANLTNADLSLTILWGAKLNGADLTGANLNGTDPNNVDFSGATWTDGRVCAEGSVGGCF